MLKSHEIRDKHNHIVIQYVVNESKIRLGGEDDLGSTTPSQSSQLEPQIIVLKGHVTNQTNLI